MEPATLLDEIQAKRAELERLALAQEFAARKAAAPADLIAFAQATMPSPQDPIVSVYRPGPPHRLMAEKLAEMFEGRRRRLVLVMPPRTGKTEIASKRAPAWWVGRRPSDSVIFATYNQDYANDQGRAVREIMRSKVYGDLFPGTRLDEQSQAVDRLTIANSNGAQLVFVGRGGSITGRGGNLLIADDLFKDAEEAASPLIRDKAWTWFTRTFLTRQMDDEARVLLIGTRWHEDDVIGRLTDPRNPCYDAIEASKWEIVRLAALAEEDDPLGRTPGEALWPERFGVDFLEGMRRIDRVGFSALYQGRPTPEEGAFFTADMIHTYNSVDDLPRVYRVFAASDHAVSTKQKADRSCFPVGYLDQDDVLWIHPDLFWKRADTKEQAEAMLRIGRTHKPMFWFAESGHISKSVGPFLKKMMVEEGVWFPISEVVPSADKMTRAQSFQGRMALGKVRWPAFAPWWPDARSEILSFPFGPHDDLVDGCSLFGLKLNRQTRPGPMRAERPRPKMGTLGDLKAQAKAADRERRRQNMRAIFG